MRTATFGKPGPQERPSASLSNKRKFPSLRQSSFLCPLKNPPKHPQTTSVCLPVQGWDDTH